MKLNKILVLVLLTSTISTYGQLKIDAEFRPRFEFRHGYKTLFPDDANPATFVSQRTRLSADFNIENLNFYLSVQDVRVWGDVPQLNRSDRNGFTIHQAWAQISLNDNFALKAGRQEIVYDDSRIFGNVGWAQQARSHDMALLKYSDENFKMDVGFAFNQDGESLKETTLTTNTYKAIQYAWFHKTWEHFSGSFLFLNNGLQYIDDVNSKNNDTRYSQTVGSHLKFSKSKVKFTANLYYQFGNDLSNNKLKAYLLGLEANYKIAEKTNLWFGFELQSGNDNGLVTQGENNAFTPFYGTNHKFNGLMDYFYVGNHSDNVGLLDLYIKANITLNPKSNLNIAFHNFRAAANFNKRQLGNEMDFVYANKLQNHVTLKIGYSHLFESEGMEILKGIGDDNTNNWAWIMLVVNPTLFQNTK